MDARDRRARDRLRVRLVVRRPPSKQVEREAGGERHDGDLRVDSERARDDARVRDVDALDAAQLEVGVYHPVTGPRIRMGGSEGMEAEQGQLTRPDTPLPQRGEVAVAELRHPGD